MIDSLLSGQDTEDKKNLGLLGHQTNHNLVTHNTQPGHTGDKDKKNGGKMYGSFLESEKPKPVHIKDTTNDIKMGLGEPIYSQNNLKINS